MNLLTDLMREGNMKEFYKVANKVLMIRTNNPVVRHIRKGIKGEEEIIEDRNLVEEAIANYFKEIYKRPEHMIGLAEDDEDMRV